MALLLGVAVVLVWAYLLFGRGGYWQASMDENPLPLPVVWPSVAVLIPARNEADMLPRCLPTVLNNQYPGALQVMLVDDRSADGTGEIGMQISHAHRATDRLVVLQAPPLPAGWKGKVAAMQAGLDALVARGDHPRYVLCTDADIGYNTGSIARLVAHAEAGNYVLSSRMVKLRCESAAERFLIPAFVHFFRMLYPFAWVNHPRNKLAAAAGGCMLLRFDALKNAGGFAPIKNALIDDCALGRLMKNHGPIWLGLTDTIHSLRPYPRLSDIRSMVARTAYDQLGYSPLQLAGSIIGMAITYLAPLGLAIIGSGDAQLLGVLASVAMLASFIPITKFYGQSPLRALLLPVVALCYMGFTLDSAYQYHRGRGGMWKGHAQAGKASTA